MIDFTAVAFLLEVKLSYKKNKKSGKHTGGNWKPLEKNWEKIFWKEQDILEAIFDEKQKYKMINL